MMYIIGHNRTAPHSIATWGSTSSGSIRQGKNRKNHGKRGENQERKEENRERKNLKSGTFFHFAPAKRVGLGTPLPQEHCSTWS